MVKSLTIKRHKQFLTVTSLTQYTVKKNVTFTSLPLITVLKNLSSLSYCNDHKIRSFITTVNTKKWCLLPLINMGTGQASQRSYRPERPSSPSGCSCPGWRTAPQENWRGLKRGEFDEELWEEFPPTSHHLSCKQCASPFPRLPVWWYQTVIVWIHVFLPVTR
jgi:hypothetical protein